MNDLEIAMGWTLIHAVWQAGIAAIAVAALFNVIRSSSVRYALACTALLAVVSAFVVTFVHFVPQRYGATGLTFQSGRDPREFAAPIETAGESIKFDLENALPWISRRFG